VLSALPNTDGGELAKLMEEYHALLFPEDDSKERFEDRASKKLEWWLGKEVDLARGPRGFSLDLKDA
jgi:hypothetical protein